MARRGRPLSDERQQRKRIAEADFIEFVNLVRPQLILGSCHRELAQWWEREDRKKKQMVLFPREHLKSTLIALRATWRLTKDPALRILLISSTSNLATKQLKYIKDILTSDTYRIYWPEMVNKDEAKREKWTEREISIDHPTRKKEGIRDPSIFTAGLTTNIVGLHSDIAILDDVVVQSNAYTEDGREKVREQYGYLSSVEGASSEEWVVGTRYHPNDLYSDLIAMRLEEYDEDGNVISRDKELYEVFERQVESVGDGTGEFLWPRTKAPNGRWYGFNQEVLGEKRAQYINKIHFRAQYYNDPHDIDTSPIKRDLFQYYDRNFLVFKTGKWFFKGNYLNVVAAVDFAYTAAKSADYTAIVVVGVTGGGDYYILDVDRFKTDKISDYYGHILKLYEKWGFRKIRCEVTAGQSVIVKDLKENYIRRYGLSLSIDEFKPSRWIGSKEERILATLEPRYANRQIWHYQGGNCQTLEEELLFQNPAHDDCKDALASAIDFAVQPLNLFRFQKENVNVFQYHGRFGGVV